MTNPNEEEISTEETLDAEETEGMTRLDNAEVEPAPSQEQMSGKMRVAFFVTIAAVFVVGPCVALLVFGELGESLASMLG